MTASITIEKPLTSKQKRLLTIIGIAAKKAKLPKEKGALVNVRFEVNPTKFSREDVSDIAKQMIELRTPKMRGWYGMMSYIKIISDGKYECSFHPLVFSILTSIGEHPKASLAVVFHHWFVNSLYGKK